MARVRSVKRYTQPGHTPRRFNVDLNEGEADLLIALLSRVTGDASNSPRKYVGRILRPLVQAAGTNCLGTDAYGLVEGVIKFNDYKPRERKAESDDDVEYVREFMKWYVNEYRRSQNAAALPLR